MDGWTQTLSAGWLLGIAAMAIVLILLLICETACPCAVNLGVGEPADGGSDGAADG